ncbi:hypothetical protein L209DRAFT_754499 [Thermothelomyces heterothallicus CBS 203.75]
MSASRFSPSARRSGDGLLLLMWAVLNGQGWHRSPGGNRYPHLLDRMGRSFDRPLLAPAIRRAASLTSELS